MINPKIGSPLDVDGKRYIMTHAGADGHAIYGPYEALDAGYYAVEFHMRPAEEFTFARDEVCAEVDVATDKGTVILAHDAVRLSQLQHGAIFVPLIFHNTVRQRLEFRVQVWGQIPLVIEDRCPVIPVNDANADYPALLEQARFPDLNDPSMPEVFRQYPSSFHAFHENGALFKVVDGRLILTMGVSFYTNIPDDIILIAELFMEHVYNFIADGEWCAIDIGMNIGLTSLLLAAKPFIREVHGFEPFYETVERARANLSLNPDIAHKIRIYNVGLEDKDTEKTILIREGTHTGAYTTIGSRAGTPHHISVRKASVVLRPIIEAAKACGREVLVKVDCEGSEFSVFESLEADGLIEDISAFMVEWHRINWMKTQSNLIDPLLRRRFVVFDLSRKGVNGFFYAVRRR